MQGRLAVHREPAAYVDEGFRLSGGVTTNSPRMVNAGRLATDGAGILPPDPRPTTLGQLGQLPEVARARS
jgi:hypothetical protein